jgi:hypothetical protein
MNPKMEKAPEKVAPISVPLLHDYQNSAEMKNTQSEHLLFFKNGIRDGFVTGTKEEERSENVLKSLHSDRCLSILGASKHTHAKFLDCLLQQSPSPETR